MAETSVVAPVPITRGKFPLRQMEQAYRAAQGQGVVRRLIGSPLPGRAAPARPAEPETRNPICPGALYWFIQKWLFV